MESQYIIFCYVTNNIFIPRPILPIERAKEENSFPKYHSIGGLSNLLNLFGISIAYFCKDFQESGVIVSIFKFKFYQERWESG
jgi:hypothetical protein